MVMSSQQPVKKKLDHLVGDRQFPLLDRLQMLDDQDAAMQAKSKGRLYLGGLPHW
jgi:hypothetical protein